MRIHARALAIWFSLQLCAQPPKSVLGTIAVFRPESAEIDVRTEADKSVPVKISGATTIRKVAPGQTDLTKAEDIKATDMIVGDRVLVTLGPDQKEARRIIVIPANDISKRDAADRADWQKRGINGVVTAVEGNAITVELRALSGAAKFSVTAGPKTTFRRYAPDSVRFADAKPSALSELRVGDQVRARGTKSPDGTKVDAEDIVFGTFVSMAGTITSLDPSSRELTVRDLTTKKTMIVRFVGETVVKRVPDSAAPPGRGADIAQLIEALPAVKFEDLKKGEVFAVSAIGAAQSDRMTAITFLANAEALVRLASSARGSGPAPSLAGLASSISNVGP